MPSPTEDSQTAAQHPINTAPEPILTVPASANADPSGGIASEAAAAEWHSHPPETPGAPAAPTHVPGGSKELLKLAAPLILSQSFMTVQVFVDTILLSWHNPLEMTASFPAVMWYWLFFGVLQVTAGYTSTFVAQYTGANRPHRVGVAVWQGVHFAFIAGLLFLVGKRRRSN